MTKTAYFIPLYKKKLNGYACCEKDKILKQEQKG